MELNSTPLIFIELKKVMRERGLSYQQVAEMIGLSESGFKKIMSSTDCSLQKLERICIAIGVRLSDLVTAAEKRELLNFVFSETEEEYFLKNREGFQVYWFLVYERRSNEEVQELMGMEKKKFLSVVRSLDKINLLQLLPNDRILLPTPRGIRWVGKSRFVFSLYKKWSQILLETGLRALEKTDRSKDYFNIRYLRMSEGTWRDFTAQLEKLEVEYSNRATAEMRMNTSALRHVRWLTVVDNESWGEADLNEKIIYR